MAEDHISIVSGVKIIFINGVAQTVIDKKKKIGEWRGIDRQKGTIYQPLRSGRIWHKVNF